MNADSAIRKYLSQLGKRGGASKSARKVEAGRRNVKLAQIGSAKRYLKRYPGITPPQWVSDALAVDATAES